MLQQDDSKRSLIVKQDGTETTQLEHTKHNFQTNLAAICVYCIASQHCWSTDHFFCLQLAFVGVVAHQGLNTNIICFGLAGPVVTELVKGKGGKQPERRLLWKPRLVSIFEKKNAWASSKGLATVTEKDFCGQHF